MIHVSTGLDSVLIKNKASAVVTDVSVSGSDEAPSCQAAGGNCGTMSCRTFGFNKNHSEKFTTLIWTPMRKVKFIGSPTTGVRVKMKCAVYARLPSCRPFFLFHLPNRISQCESFHQHGGRGMWNRLRRRNGASAAGLASSRKRMRRRGRECRVRRTRQAARRNTSHVRGGRVSTARLQMGI